MLDNYKLNSKEYYNILCKLDQYRLGRVLGNDLNFIEKAVRGNKVINTFAIQTKAVNYLLLLTINLQNNLRQG